MHKFVLFSCVFLLYISSSFGLSNDDKNGLIALHNTLRAEAYPAPSSPLANLTWNSNLAAISQTWANKCVKRYSTYRTSTLLGEVIFVGTSPNLDLGSAYAAIDAQRLQYDFDTMSCKASSCNSWTQVVSNTTTYFGCGWAKCSFGAMLVCNYQKFAQYPGVNPYEPVSSSGGWKPTTKPDPTKAPTTTTTTTTTKAPTTTKAAVTTKAPTTTIKATTKVTTTKAPTTRSPTFTVAPGGVDYRGTNLVNAVRNQGSCGSCWAFSASAVVEGATALKYGSSLPLSPQQLLDCTSGSCTGGWPATALSDLISNSAGHQDTFSSYPYTGFKGATCNYKPADVAGSIVQSGTTNTDKQSILAALKQYGPVAVAVNADTKWQNYQSGILSASASNVNHAVLLVGYDPTKDAWIIKNSWGASWGMSGYCYVAAQGGVSYGISLYGAMWAVSQ